MSLYLAQIDSKAVDNFLVEHSKKYFSGEDGAWIGAKRAKKGSPFYWTDGLFYLLK